MKSTREIRKTSKYTYVVIFGNAQYAVDTTAVKCSCGGAPLCDHYQGVKSILNAERFIRSARVAAGRA